MTIAEQFGARISLSLPGLGLFLMVSRRPGRIAALVGQGGRVAVPLDPCRALVMMPVTRYLGLRGHPELSFIGPVHLDQDRFARVAAAHAALPSFPDRSSSTAPSSVTVTSSPRS